MNRRTDVIHSTIKRIFIFIVLVGFIVLLQYCETRTIKETQNKFLVPQTHNVVCYDYGTKDMSIIDYTTGLIVTIEAYETVNGYCTSVIVEGQDIQTYYGKNRDKKAIQRMKKIFNDIKRN